MSTPGQRHSVGASARVGVYTSSMGASLKICKQCEFFTLPERTELSHQAESAVLTRVPGVASAHLELSEASALHTCRGRPSTVSHADGPPARHTHMVPRDCSRATLVGEEQGVPAVTHTLESPS